MGVLNIEEGINSFDENTREWQNKLRFRYVISDKSSYIRRMLNFDDNTVPERLKGPYAIHDEFLKYVTYNSLWTELKEALETVNDNEKMMGYIRQNYMVPCNNYGTKPAEYIPENKNVIKINYADSMPIYDDYIAIYNMDEQQIFNLIFNT